MRTSKEKPVVVGKRRSGLDIQNIRPFYSTFPIKDIKQFYPFCPQIQEELELIREHERGLKKECYGITVRNSIVLKGESQVGGGWHVDGMIASTPLPRRIYTFTTDNQTQFKRLEVE